MATSKKKTRYATNITSPTGRVYISAKTKEELEQKVLQAKMEIGMGIDLNNNQTFDEYAALWLRVYKTPNLRENSYATLVSNMENHVIPAFTGMRMRDVKPLHVQAFRGSIAHLSKSVQSKCMQAARSIFRTAVDNGIISKSPMVSEDKPGGASTKEEEPLTDEQAVRLLKALEGTKAYDFCRLGLVTGMRRSELLGLMWDDVDLELGVIHVAHSKVFPAGANDAPVTTLLKSEAASRDLALDQDTVARLRCLKARSTSPFVLSMGNGKSLTRSAFKSLWAIVTTRTVSEGRPLGTQIRGSKHGPVTVSLDFTCHPHQLRHTYITKLFEEGLDIKEVQTLAGHSDPSVTMKIYTHYRDKQRRAATADKVRSAVSYLSAM